MINQEILISISEWIPAGQRSNFVNGALEKAIIQYKRQKASDMMDELREKANIKLSTKEMIRLKNYGRE